ncbi:hypothetical protein E4T66_01505 [Sinimarinibacterium sp. CAU 1509]|uniref:BcsE family c-di-GMP-binding protein n=1 Tax=Sinimarinibacterium sp. CAU 1509 TaxID=2562283 RepID=UPI0010AB8573|nr:BcsE family c-di-GMP-binding protein [Sinimarinibacterium sp. CAU 1509]TJY64933.1 hypothetical protein E4T66_01505 [Sinimarinibacterium sp. CAU 1509]
MSTTEARLTLGIRRLPMAVGAIHPGQLYALACETPDLACPLISGLIDDAREQLQRVTVVLGARSRAWQSALERRGAGTASERERLIILGHQPPPLRDGARNNTIRLIDELDFFGAAGSVLILTDPEDLLSSDDAGLRRQLRWLRDWAAETLTAVVMVFNDLEAHSRIERLRQAGAGFVGVANLGEYSGDLALRLELWHGMPSAHDYLLRETPDHAFELRPELPARHFTEPAQLEGAKDRDQVYITRETALQDPRPPSDWTVVDEPEDLLKRADALVACTCFLEAGPPERFRSLALLVCALRRQVGSGVKIVIRDHTQRLRTVQKLILQRMGANVVVSATYGPTQLVTVFEALRDQLFLKPLPDDPEAALDALEPPASLGFLSLDAFGKQCQQSLNKAEASGIECAMVRLFLLPDVRMDEAISLCRTRRGGDVFTVDNRSLYVFLYGCWEHDVAMTLARLFARPIAELFVGHVQHTDPSAIRRALAELEARGAHLNLPDFTSASSVAMALDLSEADEPTAGDSAAPQPVRKITAVSMPLLPAQSEGMPA